MPKLANFNSSPIMTNVAATGSGGSDSRGVYNFNSSPTIRDSTVEGLGGTSNYGVYNIGNTATVIVDASQITGSTNAIFNDPDFTVRVGSSLLGGGAVTGGGMICVASYSEAHVELTSACLDPP